MTPTLCAFCQLPLDPDALNPYGMHQRCARDCYDYDDSYMERDDDDD